MVSFRQEDFMYYSNSGVPTKLKTHLHQCYEFLYFIDGDSSYIVENTIYDAKPGDLFITRPKEVHSLAFRSQKQYIRTFFQISPDYLDESQSNLLDFINNAPLGQGNRITAESMRGIQTANILNKIEHYVLNRIPESDLMIKTYVIQLLVQLKYAAANETDTLSASFESSKPENSRIQEILDYIEKHITDTISLDELAEKFYINKYYLCHTFKSETGVTIKEFVNTRRISRAKDLIMGGANMTDLCYKCGFGDYSSFYKTFKKMTGKSPKAFLGE